MFLTSEKRKHCIFLTDVSTMLSSCHHHLISSFSVRNQKMGSRTLCQRIVHYQDSFLLPHLFNCSFKYFTDFLIKFIVLNSFCQYILDNFVHVMLLLNFPKKISVNIPDVEHFSYLLSSWFHLCTVQSHTNKALHKYRRNCFRKSSFVICCKLYL